MSNLDMQISYIIGRLQGNFMSRRTNKRTVGRADRDKKEFHGFILCKILWSGNGNGMGMAIS